MTNERPLKKGDTIVGEFLIQDIFGGEGKSGMGVVYLVTSRKFANPIVLKTFQKDNYNSIERFRSEAEVWVAIGIHQNIVQALFVDEINEKLFIGAEYIAPDEYGRNTITHFLEQGGVSNQNIIKWTAQFCYGMNQATSKGLKVHRDVKPDNLMIDQDGNLKVTDFGLSKFTNEYQLLNKSIGKINKEKNGIINKFKELFEKSDNEISGLTNEGSFLGTILYASPEQIINSSNVDIRSDIYSFGIVLYQLISLGSFPYSLVGKTTLETIALMHLQEPVIKINHPLAPIAYKCLSRNINQRYQNFNELLKDLNRIAIKLNIKLPINRTEVDANLRELYIQSFTYRSLGNLDKAKELITKYISLDKNDSSAWSLKGRIEYEQGDIEEGIKSTLISYKLEPNNSKTCNNLGLFYKRQNDFPNAERFLYEAIEIDPYNTGAITNSAILYEEKGNFLLAADLIISALKLAPDKKTLHFNAGNIAANVTKQRHYDKAINILELLIKVDRENINNWFNLGLNYQLTKKLDEAIKCFKFVEKQNPDDEQTLISLAKLNGEKGNFDEAILYCEKLLDRHLSTLNAICWRAQFMQAKGHGKQAIDFMKSTISNNPKNDHLWLTLAELYSNEGDNKKAVSMIRKAGLILIENGEENNIEKMDFLKAKLKQYKKLAE
jgi:serine/threonine protein kinase/thioredoxin-like negative regulator of GroEL